MEELEEDRLSSLPKVILHCILSRMPEKDAVRTSVLSKTWLDIWYTFPILSFSTSKFMEISPVQPMEDSERMRKILGFCDHVKRSILRFRDQSLAIKEFKLKVDCFGLDNISNAVDIWLKLACECGVEVIEYSQDVSIGQDQYHVLPMCVIEGKSLTKLVLRRYIKIDPTFMNHSIKFFPLRVLSLWSVLLGDQHAINHLISFCPLIESITLRYCFVFGTADGTKEKLKSLSISGLQKLKRVDASEIQDVSIDAPSLENLCYCPNNDFDAPFKIDFDRCRSLKELWMWSVPGTFSQISGFLNCFQNSLFLVCALQVSENKHLFLSVVNILLSYYCLANISFSVYSRSKEFIELFYETLMRRKEDECFCTSDNTRCWWHSLKDVKVTSSMKMDENVFGLCISINY